MRISDWSSDVCSSDLSKALDGHFWVNGRVNGHDIRFLIDSGASITAVSGKAATDAGLDVDQSGYPTILQTANGAIEVRRSNIAVLEIGPLKRSEEHTSELQSLMHISYAVLCLKKKNKQQ